MNLFFVVLGCSPLKMYQGRLVDNLKNKGFVHHIHEKDGHHVEYWVKNSGTKTPVLLLHGFGGSGSWTWQRMLDAVSEDRPVLVPDLLWFGNSHSSRPPTLQTQADAVQSVLDEQNWTSFDLVGTSYGGFVSVQLSLMMSQNIKKLILIDSPGPVFSLQDVEALNQRFAMKDPSGLFVPTEPEGIRSLLDICYHGDTPPIPKGILEDMWKTTSFSKHHDEKRLLLRDLLEARDTFVDVQWKVDALIWGEYDEIFPLQEAYELKEETGAELHIIQNTAHCPFVEKPKEFRKVFIPLLSQ